MKTNSSLEVEGYVEEGQEGVDELKEDKFGHSVRLELFLRPVVLPLGELVAELEVVYVEHQNEDGVGDGRDKAEHGGLGAIV